MQDVILYRSPRGGGKTSFVLDQSIKDVIEGRDVAIVVPSFSSFDAIEYMLPNLFNGGFVDIYSENTFQRARGRIYEHIYVDNADLFYEDPAELCWRTAPGVPVTMTYTPIQ